MEGDEEWELPTRELMLKRPGLPTCMKGRTTVCERENVHLLEAAPGNPQKAMIYPLSTRTW